MTSPTVRDVYGLCCPRCARDEFLRLEATSWFDLTPEGLREATDVGRSWENHHLCSCDACGTFGTYASFRIEEVAP